jgi:hypothetical protein
MLLKGWHYRYVCHFGHIPYFWETTLPRFGQVGEGFCQRLRLDAVPLLSKQRNESRMAARVVIGRWGGKRNNDRRFSS